MKRNKVFICGAGPGDAGLITVKGMSLIKNCDVVFYDRLVDKKIIDEIPAKSEKIFVGRSAGDSPGHQDYTNRLMVTYARKGKKVLRLKGGDPFVFGRGAEGQPVIPECRRNRAGTTAYQKRSKSPS